MGVVGQPAARGEGRVHSRLRLVGGHVDVEVRAASRRGVAGDRVEGELGSAAQRVDGIRVAPRGVAQ
ncbi:MAG: hypothetical protein K0S49_779, partial [Microbacterium sp.]|nr:hypothetical protein [Microbacterium sp.]